MKTSNKIEQNIKFFLEGIWKGQGVLIVTEKYLSRTYLEDIIIKRSTHNTFTINQKAVNLNDESEVLHSETGFIKVHEIGSDQIGEVEFYLSHPFGACEVTEGYFTGNEISVESTRKYV